jgi:hypothetical protein
MANSTLKVDKLEARDDAEFIKRSVAWVLNLILAMEALPELVERGR